MTVPLYLDNPGPGGNFVLGSDGPPQQTHRRIRLSAHCPEQHRHGYARCPACKLSRLFGRRDQAEGFGGVCQPAKIRVIATEWWACPRRTSPTCRHHPRARTFPNSRASPIDWTKGCSMRCSPCAWSSGRLSRDPCHQFRRAERDQNRRTLLSRRSQVGIFGASYMALSTDVTRGILAVPGQPYNLAPQSQRRLRSVLDGDARVLSRSIDLQIALGSRRCFGRAEPTLLDRIETPLPIRAGAPRLLQAALGDHQVTTLGAHVMARAIGAKSHHATVADFWRGGSRYAVRGVGHRRVRLRAATRARHQRAHARGRRSSRQGQERSRLCAPGRQVLAHRRHRLVLQRHL